MRMVGLVICSLLSLSGAAIAQPCANDADCDDAEPCTEDTCTLPAGVCANTRVAGVMFATDGGGGNLYRIDQVSGAAVLIGNTGVAVPSLTIDPETSVVYVGLSGGAALYTVDTVTGASHRVGGTGLNAWAVDALAFDGAGTLHAAINTGDASTPGGDKLAILDKRTGAGTFVGSFGVADIAGLAFDASGILYGSSLGAGSPTLYTIDVVSGAATAVGPIVDGGSSPPAGGVSSLQFDFDGTLYGGTTTGDLLEIDPATGVFTLIAGSGAPALEGLGSRDECRDPCRPPVVLYGTDGGFGNLHTVDRITGVTTIIGPLGVLSSPSLAMSPWTGVLYMGTGGGLDDLFTVCPITGEAAFVGSAGMLAWSIAALDFAPDGTLYAAVNTIGQSTRGADSLAIIDEMTAAGTLIGPFGPIDMGSIAFDDEGTLWGATGDVLGPRSLYTINLTTGAATLVAPLLDPYGVQPPWPVSGLDFDLSGFLVAKTSKEGGEFLRIDRSNGKFTIPGGAGYTGASLAFHETCRPVCNAPSTLYGTDGGGNLYRVDQVIGDATLLGDMGIPARALAIDPGTGRMYAGTGAGLDELYRVNPVSCVATLAGGTGLGCHGIVGLDFDAGGTLYAAVNMVGAGNPGADSLAVLDETTGAGTLIGGFGGGINDVGGIAFGDTGTLYAASGLGGGAPTLYTIDPATGAASTVGPILDVLAVPPAGGVSDLEFDLAGDLFAGLDNGDLIRIDPATGTWSPVEPSDIAPLDGLAFRHDCPVDCARDAHCDDGDPCTAGSCQPGSGTCAMTLLPDSETAAGVDGSCGTGDDNAALYGVDGLCGTADDGQGDGLCDAIDHCPAVWDPGNADSDIDGFGDACDCAPLDGNAWAVPGEVPLLRLEHHGGPGGTTTLAWDPPTPPGGSLPLYDTIRSERSDSFSAPDGQCVETDDGSDTAAADTLDPSPIFFYVVRAENACGQGTAGAGSDGSPRPARTCP